MFDPEVLQILGLNLMAGKSPNFAENLGNAGLATMQYRRQQEEDKLRKEEREFLKQQREMQLADMKRQQRMQQAQEDLFQRFVQPGQAPLPYNDTLGNQPPQPNIPGAPPSFDMAGYRAALPSIGPQGLEQALKLDQLVQKDNPFGKIEPEKFTPESIARFAITKNYADLVPARPREAFNLGGQTVFLDKYSLPNGTALPHTMTPGEKDSSARGWAGLRQSDLHHAQNLMRPQLVESNNGYASVVLGGPGGPQVTPVPQLGPSSKNSPSETELTAAGYANRMLNAERILTQNADAGKPTMFPTLAGAVVGAKVGPAAGRAVEGATMSPEQQAYRQAQEDWVRAKLRKESGAVIGEDEMGREITTYFPQPWDSEKVVKQKARARQVAIEQMQLAAGKARSNVQLKPLEDPLGIR